MREITGEQINVAFHPGELSYIAQMLECALVRYQDEANGNPQLFGLCDPERAREQMASIQEMQAKLRAIADGRKVP